MWNINQKKMNKQNKIQTRLVELESKRMVPRGEGNGDIVEKGEREYSQ